MLRLFGRRGGRAKEDRPEAARLVYAVGDIHGRLDLLEPLVEKILEDVLTTAPPDGSPPDLVFLGDMIDRGPDTCGVLEYLTAVAGWPEIAPVFLLGNHEQMLLGFLGEPAAHKRWLRFGGFETLMSYRLSGLGDLTDEANLPRVALALAEAMGPHIELLERCVPSYRNGNLLFAHAGALPDVAPEDQPIEAMVWGDEAFFRRRRSDGLWVVHGHTVVPEPVVKQSRISIDTGAYMSGALTALRAEGTLLSFLRQEESAR